MIQVPTWISSLSPSLKILQTWLDKVLSNLLQLALLGPWGWTGWSPEVLIKLNYPEIWWPSVVRMMELKDKMESLSFLSFCFHFDRVCYSLHQGFPIRLNQKCWEIRGDPIWVTLVRNGPIKRGGHMRWEREEKKCQRDRKRDTKQN